VFSSHHHPLLFEQMDLGMEDCMHKFAGVVFKDS